MLVTLDAFSGRPNPSWELSAAEELQLSRRLTGLPPSATAAVPTDVLGHRVFLHSGPPNVWIFGVQVFADGVVMADTFGIEAWFADQCRARGFGSFVSGG